MVRKKRKPSRNRNGGYDLSAAEQARPKRGHSAVAAGGRGAHSQTGQTAPIKSSRRSRRHGSHRDEDIRERELLDEEPQQQQQPEFEAAGSSAADAVEDAPELDARAAEKQAMREAAELAASHIAAQENARAEREARLAAASGERPRDAHDHAPAPASGSASEVPDEGLAHRTTGTEEHITVGYSEPGDTGSLSPEAAAYSADRYKARRKRKGKHRKPLIAVLVVLIVALAGAGTAFGLWYTGIADTLRGNSRISATTGSDNGEPYYVLLLGGDSRSDNPKDDYGNRSDSIMVARVDEANKNVSLLSIPRDTRVNIQGHGAQKINSAIEFGGYDATVKEVNELLGIQINYYAFIYFDGFEELVDKLGGVTVKVPEGTYYHGVSVPAGDAVEINGKEALVLARCRHGNPPDQGAYAMGDYQRTLNQRNLIKAIAKKVLDQDMSKMPDLISSISQCLETNMDVSKILSLAQNMKGLKVSKIKADTLPYAGASIDGAWYAIPYEDVFEDVKANFKAGKDPYDGLSKYNVEANGNDIGSDYTDGDVYSYTNYRNLYGEYKGKGTPKQLKSSTSSSSSSVYSG